MWFGMADAGALPKQLKYVHPKYKTPVGTILTEVVVAFIAAFVLYQVLYAPADGFRLLCVRAGLCDCGDLQRGGYCDGSVFLARATVSVQPGASPSIPGSGDGCVSLE